PLRKWLRKVNERRRDNMKYVSPEWSVEEWTREWTIHVGKAYACSVCGTIIMVTKGGIGVLDPICCGKPMELVVNPDEIRNKEAYE
ncbi:MAG: hypothetical protein QME81_18630, partial [bacterium]|nr:hypothetical protein [bacterium]